MKMNKLLLFLSLFLVLCLVFSPVGLALFTDDGDNGDGDGGGDDDDGNNGDIIEPPIMKPVKGNNGWGNGDQDAPGNSGGHNNAENNNSGKTNPIKSGRL